MTRPEWNRYFLGIAQAVSTRATCPRLSVGAVIVSPEHRILSTGYNGAPPGADHCLDKGCEIVDGHCIRALHADRNAILFARADLKGATLYLWGGPPCLHCAQDIVTVGIVRVISRGDYVSVEILRGVDFLERNGVGVKQLRGDGSMERDMYYGRGEP